MPDRSAERPVEIVVSGYPVVFCSLLTTVLSKTGLLFLDTLLCVGAAERKEIDPLDNDYFGRVSYFHKSRKRPFDQTMAESKAWWRRYIENRL